MSKLILFVCSQLIKKSSFSFLHQTYMFVGSNQYIHKDLKQSKMPCNSETCNYYFKKNNAFDLYFGLPVKEHAIKQMCI